MHRLAGLLCATLVALPHGAWAQDDIDAEIEKALAADDDKKPAAKSAAAAESPAAPAAEPAAPATGEAEELPQIGEDQLAVFVLQRGFYLAGDLGFLMTFGGTRGYSNVQPYVALKAGFDINDYLGAQVSVSSGYSSGNPLSDNDAGLGTQGQEVINYSLFSFGAELVGALRPTERFAIEPRVGGGMTRIHPAPHDPGDPSAFIPGMLPHASAGFDFKYLTLLTDFTAGVSLTGYFLFGPKLIPAGAAAFVVRYTF
jgi:hypothetical protein